MRLNDIKPGKGARKTRTRVARGIGSGLGKNNAWRGDFDIQLFDEPARRQYHLDTLRFGDMVADRPACRGRWMRRWPSA